VRYRTNFFVLFRVTSLVTALTCAWSWADRSRALYAYR
jgi:hypothetical protein